MERKHDTHVLYEGERHLEADAHALDERTRAIVLALHHQRTADVEAITKAIIGRESRTTFEVDPFYMAVGDTADRLIRNVPPLPEPGQWVFDGFVAWADPAAAANVNVTMEISGIHVPLAFVASKTDVISRGDLRIPVNQQTRAKFTCAGTNADRAVVVMRYARYL